MGVCMLCGCLVVGGGVRGGVAGVVAITIGRIPEAHHRHAIGVLPLALALALGVALGGGGRRRARGARGQASALLRAGRRGDYGERLGLAFGGEEQRVPSGLVHRRLRFLLLLALLLGFLLGLRGRALLAFVANGRLALILAGVLVLFPVFVFVLVFGLFLLVLPWRRLQLLDAPLHGIQSRGLDFADRLLLGRHTETLGSVLLRKLGRELGGLLCGNEVGEAETLADGRSAFLCVLGHIQEVVGPLELLVEDLDDFFLRELGRDIFHHHHCLGSGARHMRLQ
mmetsp:Transcript_85306/g.246269  ORF Transcript_85306/g.246269 Transcript_85306/m.246269 type:complete len:283 (+) Transcript_85306:683-1531(+)